MKNFILTFFILIFSSFYLNGSWSMISNFGGGNREITIYFSIKDKGYVGCGRNNGMLFNDIWEYNSVLNSWTQKASYPAGGLMSPGVFVINNIAYVVSGMNSWGGFNNLVYSFDPISNLWVQKHNFPGVPRYSTIGFSINGKGYLTTGFSNSLLNDFWEYNYVTDTWIQLGNFPGGYRQHATAISVYGKAYVGLGYDGASYSDWWEYDPTLNIWTLKAVFPGGGRRGVVSMELNGKVLLGTGYNNYFYYNDFWEYNPNTNSWIQLDSIPAMPRYGAAGFSLSGCAYIGTGSNNGIISPYEYSDFYKRCEDKSNDINETQPDFNIYYIDNFQKKLVIQRESSKYEKMVIKLFSIDGKEILANYVKIQNNQTSVDVSNLSKGVYLFLLIVDENELMKGKFIIN